MTLLFHRTPFALLVAELENPVYIYMNNHLCYRENYLRRKGQRRHWVFWYWNNSWKPFISWKKYWNLDTGSLKLVRHNHKRPNPTQVIFKLLKLGTRSQTEEKVKLHIKDIVMWLTTDFSEGILRAKQNGLIRSKEKKFQSRIYIQWKHIIKVRWK